MIAKQTSVEVISGRARRRQGVRSTHRDRDGSFLEGLSDASPFIGGGGEAYGLSSWIGNIFNNLAYYLAISRASALLLGVSFLAEIVLSLRRPAYRQIAVRHLLAGRDARRDGTYLVLPKNFDFYGVNYLPLIAFSIVPLTFATKSLALSRHKDLERQLAVGALLMVTISGLWSLDRDIREASLHWIRLIREVSARQADETRRAYELRLSSRCCDVTVRGAEDTAQT